MTTAAARLITLITLAACGPVGRRLAPPAAPAAVALLVLAPHPDDETLMAAGLLDATLHGGGRAAGVVMTNGDYTCARDGHLRQRESVAAMRVLGVAEDDVHFLGYPDGYLARLGDTPLAPIERRAADGSCDRATGTYADRGHGRADVHRERTGTAGAYTAAEAVGDLGALLGRLRPRAIVVTHGIDDHPDHAQTYVLLRRAIDAGALPGPVHLRRAIVHAGPCWPNGNSTHAPCPEAHFDPTSPRPALPAPLDGYAPTERVPVPAAMRAVAPGENLLLRALESYRSQVDPDLAHDWLVTFARADEGFHDEVLVRDAANPARFVREGGALAPRVRFRVRCATGAGAVLRVGATDAAWSFTLADDHGTATLAPPRGVPRPLPLPEDRDDRAHTYELRFDARADDGGFVEASVYRDGDFFALSVAHGPSPDTARVTVEASGGCTVARLSGP